MSVASDMVELRHGDVCTYGGGHVGFIIDVTESTEPLLVQLLGHGMADSIQPVPVNDSTYRLMSGERLREIRDALRVPLHVRSGALSLAGRKSVGCWHWAIDPIMYRIWPTPQAVDVFKRVAGELKLESYEREIAFYVIFARFWNPEYMGEAEPAVAA